MKKKRIYVLSDSLPVCRMVVSAASRAWMGNFEEKGSTDYLVALSEVETLDSPDVAIIDSYDEEGIEVATAFREKFPAVALVFLVRDEEDALRIARVAGIGVATFLVKERADSEECLVRVLERL